MNQIVGGIAGAIALIGSGFTLYTLFKGKNKSPETNYVESPERYDGKLPSVFLGGGIANCPDWRKELIPLIHERAPGIVLFNPRRKHFDISNKKVASEQILWEYDHLVKAEAILFWFCEETFNPITLYELGAWSVHSLNKPLFVGCHPNYQRKNDVCIQTQLVRPEVVVVFSVEELASQVVAWYKSSDLS